MREILFRGKNADTGEWVYGAFIPDLLEVYQGDTQLDGFIKPFGRTKEERQMVEVERGTVGQYTGLTDKNGTRVFEGDIVKLTINRNYIFSVDWVNDCGMYCLKCLNRHPKHNFEALDTDFTVFNGDETEIIGNIHDNADLLGGENNAKEQ